jgi:hypothetical protein
LASAGGLSPLLPRREAHMEDLLDDEFEHPRFRQGGSFSPFNITGRRALLHP